MTTKHAPLVSRGGYQHRVTGVFRNCAKDSRETFSERVFEVKYTKVAASNADESRHHEEESLEMSLAIRGGHV